MALAGECWTFAGTTFDVAIPAFTGLVTTAATVETWVVEELADGLEIDAGCGATATVTLAMPNGVNASPIAKVLKTCNRVARVLIFVVVIADFRSKIAVNLFEFT